MTLEEYRLKVVDLAARYEVAAQSTSSGEGPTCTLEEARKIQKRSVEGFIDQAKRVLDAGGIQEPSARERVEELESLREWGVDREEILENEGSIKMAAAFGEMRRNIDRRLAALKALSAE